MQAWVIQMMQSMGERGFVGILLLMALENIIPPIPSELVPDDLHLPEPDAGSPVRNAGLLAGSGGTVRAGKAAAGGAVGTAGL